MDFKERLEDLDQAEKIKKENEKLDELVKVRSRDQKVSIVLGPQIERINNEIEIGIRPLSEKVISLGVLGILERLSQDLELKSEIGKDDPARPKLTFYVTLIDLGDYSSEELPSFFKQYKFSIGRERKIRRSQKDSTIWTKLMDLWGGEPDPLNEGLNRAVGQLSLVTRHNIRARASVLLKWNYSEVYDAGYSDDLSSRPSSTDVSFCSISINVNKDRTFALSSSSPRGDRILNVPIPDNKLTPDLLESEVAQIYFESFVKK